MRCVCAADKSRGRVADAARGRFDAFRSIFPAGTVSGAPKIKAIELVYELEQERRGVYAGAVGRFDFAEDEMDTCIAIRTMLFQGGMAYLQAGGGIVHDSVEEDEYQETINKLQGNVRALEAAESALRFTHLDYFNGADRGLRRVLVRHTAEPAKGAAIGVRAKGWVCE